MALLQSPQYHGTVGFESMEAVAVIPCTSNWLIIISPPAQLIFL